MGFSAFWFSNHCHLNHEEFQKCLWRFTRPLSLHKPLDCESLIWETVSPRTHKPKIVNESLTTRLSIFLYFQRSKKGDIKEGVNGAGLQHSGRWRWWRNLRLIHPGWWTRRPQRRDQTRGSDTLGKCPHISCFWLHAQADQNLCYIHCLNSIIWRFPYSINNIT